MDNRARKLIDMMLVSEGNMTWTRIDGDSGAETFSGISRKYNPNWNGWKIVDSYKPLKNYQKIKNDALQENVREYYYKNYYLAIKADKLEYLPIAGHVFDHGVNAGLKNGIKILQKAINKACKVSIAVDGIIGNQTLSYANGEKKEAIAKEIVNQRNTYYKNIVASKPSQKKFLNGWLNRVKRTDKELNGGSSSNVLLTLFGSDSFFSQILKFIYEIIVMLKK